MLPREHGAYGQLLVPVLTAMAMGQPTLAALALAISASAAFIAHEPLMILIGRRGVRARDAQRPKALTWLLLCGTASIGLGASGVARLPEAHRWTVLVPVALAGAAALEIARGRERSTSGEIVVAAALASVSFPVSIAAAVATAEALTCALAFMAAFVAATLGVRAVIGATRRSGAPAGGVLALGLVAMLAALAGLAGGGVILPAGVWAAAPVVAIALALVLALPSARYLRPIGWTLVGATTLAGVILVAALR